MHDTNGNKIQQPRAEKQQKAVTFYTSHLLCDVTCKVSSQGKNDECKSFNTRMCQPPILDLLNLGVLSSAPVWTALF